MDPHDDDLNLRDIVEPRTEAERVELEEAVGQYRAERVEAAARDNVVYLPSARLGQVPQTGPGQGELVPDEAIEGELLSPQESAELDRRRAGVRVKQLGQVSVAQAGAVVHWVRQSEHPVGRDVLRHSIYVLAGAQVVAQRVREAHSNSRFERMIRAAEVTGDRDKVADWVDRAEQAKDRRHKRVMDWVRAPLDLAKALGVMVLTVLGILVGLGIVLAVASKDPGLVMGPITAVLAFIAWITMIVTLVWTFIVMALPVAGVFYLWHTGKTAGKTPGWLQVATKAVDAVVIDERSIAHALQHLGIGPLAKYFKDGGQLVYTRIPSRDGLGVSAQVRLPAGTAAEIVINKKTLLAANLGRAGVETWPSTGDDEGLLDLWVADRGGLDTSAGQWPLSEGEDPINVYQGVPVGMTMRGEQVVAPIDGTSWLIGGRPGQGKTTFARLLVLGACLDPAAEVWVHVMADNGDYEPLKRRLTRYRVGLGTDVAEAALEAFNDLLVEMEHRGQVMRERGAATAAEAGFGPLVAAFDEVHRLFQHRVLGEDAGIIAEDVIKQARKYGIIIILITQSPTATSIPKGVTREVICRVAFSVIDQVANDALLGSGKHRQGVRATELRPGSKQSPGDRGKALTVGVVPDCDWSMVIGYLVDLDGVHQVAERSLRLLDAEGRQVAPTPEIEAPRDLLEDLSEVLGDEPVRSGNVLALLMRLAPRWAPYRTMTVKSLRAELAELGIKVPSTGNTWPIDPAAVRAALAKRSTADLDDDQ